MTPNGFHMLLFELLNPHISKCRLDDISQLVIVAGGRMFFQNTIYLPELLKNGRQNVGGEDRFY